MFPHQFFELTPHEVGTWLGPAWQGRVEQAYFNARLQRARRLPDKSSELWDDPQRLQTPDQMYRRMRLFMEQQKKQLRKAASDQKRIGKNG
ncbi:hypothetical protein MPL3356_60477 [Mesorhizobium plurifarium]|uniref:Uncharacterized protein n=1 Tax=Mesorhizobium plurifarium TaxID=69974 RepID=A0A090E9P7_MESPL|nr:hypothetical protein MPL3356_60477 [Mesorhizobium plurifarium]